MRFGDVLSVRIACGMNLVFLPNDVLSVSPSLYIYISTYVCKCEKMIQVKKAAKAPTHNPYFPVQGLVPVCPGSLRLGSVYCSCTVSKSNQPGVPGR